MEERGAGGRRRLTLAPSCVRQRGLHCSRDFTKQANFCNDCHIHLQKSAIDLQRLQRIAEMSSEKWSCKLSIQSSCRVPPLFSAPLSFRLESRFVVGKSSGKILY